MFSLLTAEISFPDFGININPPDGFPLFFLYIRFYSIVIVAGILLAMLYAVKVRERYNLTVDNILDAVIYGTPVAIIGARLFYVIFEWNSFQSFWDIFKIWNGGLAIYGGILAALAAAYVYTRLSKISFLSLMDVASMGFLIGQSLGRWGNFFNREAYGTITDLPWRMDITGVAYGVHPTFLYESLWNILGFVLLHFYSKSKLRKAKGEIFTLYMGWYGIGRAFIEGMRSDSLMLLNTGIRVSQVLGGFFFAASIVFFIILRRKEMQKKILEEQKDYVPLYSENIADDDIEDAKASGNNSPDLIIEEIDDDSDMDNSDLQNDEDQTEESTENTDNREEQGE